MATCDLSTLLADACASGFTELNEQQFRAVALQLACDISAGGGGGGGGSVFSGNYGGVAPVIVPTTTAAIAIDTSDGTVWYWYSGAWH